MNIKIVTVTLGIVVFVVIGMALLRGVDGGLAYDTDTLKKLATCLTEKGAVFYGSAWCGHCKNQKTAFGDASELLPYVECSTSNGSLQALECMAAQIESYPTWDFPDGTRALGHLPFETLINHSGCELSTL